MTTYQIGFILEQVLGHVTHAKNLQQNVPGDPEVRAHWGLVPFETVGLSNRPRRRTSAPGRRSDIPPDPT